MDGFYFAKKLDKWTNWDTTRDDMEALDEVDHLVDEYERAAEKAWAEEHRVGTGIKEGVITGIYDYTPATFRVKEDGCTNDSRHRIITFEDAVVA